MTYSVFTIPATVLSKRFNAALVIPLLVIGWGALSIGSSGVKGFPGLLGCRIAMGVLEAGFMPCATFYVSLFYQRKEMSLRNSSFGMMGFIAVYICIPDFKQILDGFKETNLIAIHTL